MRRSTQILSSSSPSRCRTRTSSRFLDISDSKNVESALRDRAAAFEAADNLDRVRPNFLLPIAHAAADHSGYADLLNQCFPARERNARKKTFTTILQTANASPA